jgi:replicative DNA helicase
MLQAMHFAATQGFPVGCISLEMRAQQLMRRLATIQSGLPAYKFRDPRQLNESEWLHAKRSMYALAELPVYVNDQSGLKPAAIASLARQMHANGARVIFVDFVQIIHEDGRDRREAINRVSAALRDTCKALEIPFVVLSQLARRDADPNRRPTMQDLRESGNLEQDAHNVLLLFRPKDKDGEWTRVDQIIVEKHREGAVGPIDVSYDDRSLTFCPRQR